MPHFSRSGHPVVTVEQFLEFVDSFRRQEPVLDLPRITGQDLFEVAKAEKSTAGGSGLLALDEVKALRPAWFS